MASIDDELAITMSYTDLGMVLSSFRDGLRHIMGEMAMMQIWESREPEPIPHEIKLSDVIERQADRALEIYFQLETQYKAHSALIDQTVSQQDSPTMAERTTENPEVVEYATSELPSIEVGQKVKYIGEACSLLPGHVYQVEELSEQETGVYLRINDGYHRLEDFNAELKIEKDDTVIYDGYDSQVVDEKEFKVVGLQHWSGTAYVTIHTSNGNYLSYPMVDFHLKEGALVEK